VSPRAAKSASRRARKPASRQVGDSASPQAREPANRRAGESIRERSEGGVERNAQGWSREAVDRRPFPRPSGGKPEPPGSPAGSAAEREPSAPRTERPPGRPPSGHPDAAIRRRTMRLRPNPQVGSHLLARAGTRPTRDAPAAGGILVQPTVQAYGRGHRGAAPSASAARSPQYGCRRNSLPSSTRSARPSRSTCSANAGSVIRPTAPVGTPASCRTRSANGTW